MLNKKHKMKLTSNIRILPLLTPALNNATSISICTLLLPWNWAKQNFCVHSLDFPTTPPQNRLQCTTHYTTRRQICFRNCTEITQAKLKKKNKHYFGVCTSATFFSDNANYIVHLTESTKPGVPTATQNTIHQQSDQSSYINCRN